MRVYIAARQHVPCKFLSVEDGLTKGVLSGVRVPDLIDDGSLLSAISNMDLCWVLACHEHGKRQRRGP